ncbi:alpha-(1,3)-fucosyltransferase C-like [Amphibalanus amphitrite]|uniref:alpha-(1,3)-fucosyltransferase C-like n=1 Tax=Amphibalanus amphitrite TaxID=1232801 RepID=UPI001C915C92|nr:alpha-(1,3)-fucosyltransferase C-like [Amphibalanus amphitrite]
MASAKLYRQLVLVCFLSISAYIVVLQPFLRDLATEKRRSQWSPLRSDQHQPAGHGAPPAEGAAAARPGHGLTGAGRSHGPDRVHNSAARAEDVRISTAAPVPPLKYILYWNEFYGSMEFQWGSGQKPFIENGCEVNTCFGTNNRKLLKMDQFDAILFHAQTLPFFDWPKVRSPHQRYVFVTTESAQYLAIPLTFYNNLFNLTLTYRRDSDFPYPYGGVEPVPSPPPTSTRNYAAGKTKLVAWFVSHCSSRSNRGKYVKLLQKYIPVDIYGKCGPLKCPRTSDNNCHKTLLNNDYKFYLSFENSICNDYVTEKLFDALKYDVVPVVLGGANYSSFAPPGSYIDALKYTPEELAKYLLKLDKDDAAYNAYFNWKGKYKNVEKISYKKSSFCDLCKYLHSDKTKIYTSMQKWWVKGQCKSLKL